MATDEKLLKRLLATFRVEAQEHIQTIASGLVPLEKASSDAEQLPILDAIFRSAHSLKGAARAVNLTDIEAVCQAVESIFAALKKRQVFASPNLFDLMHRAVDLLGQLSSSVETGSSTVPKSQVAELVAALGNTLRGKPAEAPANPPQSPPEIQDIHQPERSEKFAAADTVRIAVSKLDAVLFQTEELLSLKLAANQRAENLQQIQSKLSEWENQWTKLRTDARAFQQSIERKEHNGSNAQWQRIAEFLNWNQEFFETVQNELADATKSAVQNKRTTSAMVDSLLDEVKKAVMLPSSTLTDVFPRFVRELSREQGKEVDLVVNGGEIELDRRILEEMKDPLIHLVRNCLDHGMEKPDVRVQRGKQARGTITIGLSPVNGSHVEILISDDGGGIDPEKVKAAAMKLGLLTPEKKESLSEKESLPLIFESGISTSPIITDISGRGLGLAIVKEKVEKLNGVLSVETQLGKGTSFRIVLPLTLSRFRGIALRVQEQFFIVPTGNVERVVRLKKEAIKTVENRETISLGGETLSLARLNRVLAVPTKMNAAESADIFSAIILIAGNQRIAFLVDEIFNEEEVLVKTLGKQLARVRNIAGATVLGNGKVVPILNVSDLMHSAVRTAAAGGESVVAPARTTETKKKSILVAEDSITSRSLLKNILEASGYRVETAVDGVDAFTKLRSSEFDIVVSDVDMPRMNGFGLTAKIRSDKKLAELPVILVTSLNSRSDREHGIDVGANAYIVKSNFDQSNLLETIQRLV